MEQPRLQRHVWSRPPTASSPREEPFASEEIGDGLERGGVELRTGVKATAASRGEGGQVSLRLEGGEELRGDELLVAVGRRPRTDDLGLETRRGRARRLPGGRRPAAGRGRDWLYAIGDVNGRALLTHMGKYQARVAADHILGRTSAATADNAGLAAGRVHRAAGRGRRPDAGAGEARRGSTCAPSTSGPSANAGASFVGRNAPGTSRLVVDERARA